MGCASVGTVFLTTSELELYSSGLSAHSFLLVVANLDDVLRFDELDVKRVRRVVGDSN